MPYTFNLKPFYETEVDKPLLQDAIVVFGVQKYRADRWFSKLGHCYVFVCISGHPIQPFGKKPSQVKELIESGKLIIEKI